MKSIILALTLLLTACVPPTVNYTIVRTEVVATVIVPVTVIVTATPPTMTATQSPTLTSTATATRTPLPTATFPFPTPTRIVKSVNGVVGLAFSVEKTTVRVNEDIWFNFTVKNTNAFDVVYAGIGAVINDRKSQPSWGDATLGAGTTLEWRDHINYSVPGKYKIYLGYCWLRWRYECEQAIDANGWAWLSEPVELTITE